MTLLKGFRAAWLAVGLAAVPVGFIVYWGMIDPVLVVTEEVPPDQIPATDDPHDDLGRRRTLERGAMTISRRLCLSREAEVLVRRQFVDGVIYAMPDTTITLSKGCQERSGQIPLPSTLPPNVWYRYDVTLSRCNPIRCEARRLVPYWVKFVGPWPPTEAPAVPEGAPTL